MNDITSREVELARIGTVSLVAIAQPGSLALLMRTDILNRWKVGDAPFREAGLTLMFGDLERFAKQVKQVLDVALEKK